MEPKIFLGMSPSHSTGFPVSILSETFCIMMEFEVPPNYINVYQLLKFLYQTAEACLAQPWYFLIHRMIPLSFLHSEAHSLENGFRAGLIRQYRKVRYLYQHWDCRSQITVSLFYNWWFNLTQSAGFKIYIDLLSLITFEGNLTLSIQESP